LVAPPGNIIDAEAVECVGDSRLAWFLLRSSLDVVANQMSSMGLRGTIVYAPPGNLFLPPSVKPRKSIYLKAIEGFFCEVCSCMITLMRIKFLFGDLHS